MKPATQTEVERKARQWSTLADRTLDQDLLSEIDSLLKTSAQGGPHSPGSSRSQIIDELLMIRTYCSAFPSKGTA